MGVVENAFEIERRQISWSKLTTLNDGVTSLLYDADPNQASSSGTDGEQWLYSLPIGQLYKQSDATLWWKTAVPNTWTKVIPHPISGGGGAQYHAVVTVDSQNASNSDPVDGTHDYTYAVGVGDYYVSIDSNSILSSGESLAIDLPQATAQEKGRTLVVKDATPNSVGGVVNIRAYTGDTIDGAAMYQLNTISRASLTLYNDGTNYYVV